MAKDYLKIVLDGCIKNESEFWNSYFFREFKIAEKEHYQANEFFNGCLKIAEAFEYDVKKQYFDREMELLSDLNGTKAGTITSENPKDSIEYYENELREMEKNKFNDFYVQSRVIPMGVHIFYNHILKIKDAISEAEQMVKNETAKTLISEPQQSGGTEKIIGLESEYLPERLGNIFDSLNKDKQRIDPKRKADFISIFQGTELENWKPVKWTGSNPELATLIFKLTEIEPIPSIVNTFFDPKNTYDSHSHGGKRNENHAIKLIIKSCRK